MPNPDNKFSGKRAYDPVRWRAVYVIQGNKLRDPVFGTAPELEIHRSYIYRCGIPSQPIYEIVEDAICGIGTGQVVYVIR